VVQGVQEGTQQAAVSKQETGVKPIAQFTKSLTSATTQATIESVKAVGEVFLITITILIVGYRSTKSRGRRHGAWRRKRTVFFLKFQYCKAPSHMKNQKLQKRQLALLIILVRRLPKV